MKARIVPVPPDRAPLYAEWVAEIAAEIYDELTPDAGWTPRIRNELREHAADPAQLLLVTEVVDPTALAGRTAPEGYAEASVLLSVPHVDPLFGTREAKLRVLYTRPAYRQRGLAEGLLERAEQILRGRGILGLVADVPYGDDALTGLFERRGFVRGRMALYRSFNEG